LTQLREQKRRKIMVYKLDFKPKIRREISTDASFETITRPEFDSRQGQGDSLLRHSVQTGSGAHTASCTVGTGDSFSGGKVARGVKLTTHFYPLPRIRLRGAIPPLPSTSSWRNVLLSTEYVFMTWYLVKHTYRFTLSFTRLQWIRPPKKF
jgi:hypothetical protein